jgi:hypothetical protein
VIRKGIDVNQLMATIEAIGVRTRRRSRRALVRRSGWPAASFTEVRAKGRVSSPNSAREQLVERADTFRTPLDARQPGQPNANDHSPSGSLTSGTPTVWK